MMLKKSLYLHLPFLFILICSCGGSREKKPNEQLLTGEYEISGGSRGLHGYISYESTRPPEGYGAGISFYSAIWPLIDKPLANFQIGLPSAWIIPENRDVDFPLCPNGTYARDHWAERGPTWGSVFQTVEGGLGYWAGNRFRYGPPKFSMNATSSCYDFEIASPGWPFFHSATPLPDDKMGIAQLSNRILVPPDGLTFEGNPNGQFLGYAWMALPLMDGSDGPPPTGDQSWTLFLNAYNFKGPVAYYIAETWSKISKDYHLDYGRGLDARPGLMGGGAMEINTVPRFEAKKSNESLFFKIPQLQFPVDEEGRTILVQDVKYYSKEALYHPFKAWRQGENEIICDGTFDPCGEWEPVLSTSMPVFDQGGKLLSNMDQIFETRIFSDNVFGIQWKQSSLTPDGRFPQYFKKINDSTRKPVSGDEVPEELSSSEFALAERGDPYTSPGTGSWGTPGPASEPYEVLLADGSTVFYCWYRFVDQPSLQQFDWSREEKERLQSTVENIHEKWLTNNNYMEAPGKGELVALDPALLVTPPEAYKIGFVPIVTGQK
jgi:hypothetical protein